MATSEPMPTLAEMERQLAECHKAKAKLRKRLSIIRQCLARDQRRFLELDQTDKQLSLAIELERHGHRYVCDASRLSDQQIANMLAEIDTITLA